MTSKRSAGGGARTLMPWGPNAFKARLSASSSTPALTCQGRVAGARCARGAVGSAVGRGAVLVGLGGEALFLPAAVEPPGRGDDDRHRDGNRDGAQEALDHVPLAAEGVAERGEGEGPGQAAEEGVHREAEEG